LGRRCVWSLRMNKFKTTTLKVAVHREDVNPVFGEGVTFVSVDDEAGGPFLVIEQHDDDVKTQRSDR
jgi:hypothetical protein